MRPRARLAVLLALTAAVPASAVTEQECDDDRDGLYQDLAKNRERSLRQIRAAIEASTSEAERAYLREERVEVWHQEERQRAFGDHIWRDCLRHAQDGEKSR